MKELSTPFRKIKIFFPCVKNGNINWTLTIIAVILIENWLCARHSVKHFMWCIPIWKSECQWVMTLSHHPTEAGVSRSSPPLADPITAHLGNYSMVSTMHLSTSFGALRLLPFTRSSANPGFLNLSTVAIWSWKFLFVRAGVCVAGSDAVLIEA